MSSRRTGGPETANGLALDIQHYLAHEPVLASPPSATYRMRKFLRRHRTGVAMGLVVFLALAGGLAAATAANALRNSVLLGYRCRAREKCPAAPQDIAVG